jgi:hypothetical protein
MGGSSGLILYWTMPAHDGQRARERKESGGSERLGERGGAGVSACSGMRFGHEPLDWGRWRDAARLGSHLQ